MSFFNSKNLSFYLFLVNRPLTLIYNIKYITANTTLNVEINSMENVKSIRNKVCTI